MDGLLMLLLHIMPADRLSCWPASEEEGVFVGHGINKLGNGAKGFAILPLVGELTSYHHLNLKFLKSDFCVSHIVVAIDAFLQENFCVAYWPIIYLTIVLHCLYHHVIVTLMAISMSSSLRSVMYMLATISSSSEPSTHPCQHHSLHVTCLAYFPPPKQAGTRSQHKTKFKTHRRCWRRCLHHDVRGATGCRMSVWIHSGAGAPPVHHL